MFILTDDLLTRKADETFIFFKGGGIMNQHLKPNLKPKVDMISFIEVSLRDMQDKINLSKYLLCIYKLLYFQILSPKRQIMQICR